MQITQKPSVLISSAVLLVAAVGIILWWNASRPLQAEELPPPAEEVDQRLVNANSRFSSQLLMQLWEEEQADNLIISPPSISLALTMTLQGADSDTHQQMAELLGVDGLDKHHVNEAWADMITILQNPDPQVKVSTANSLWSREGEPFKKEFLNINQNYYGAELRELDFTDPDAPETINSWIDDKTEGRIEQIIGGQIDPETIMFLINAMHFQGQWTQEFDTNNTEDGNFYVSDNKIVNAPFMHQSGTYRYHETSEFQGVALPFGANERISMYMFLPTEKSSLDGLICRTTEDNFHSIFSSFSETEVDLTIPSFEIESDIDLKETLISMGMVDAFDRSSADFSRMHSASQNNIFVDNVKHKTYFRADEAGAEATAATSVEIGITSVQEKPQFTANRPFVFFIYDDLTETILFAGWLINPSNR